MFAGVRPDTSWAWMTAVSVSGSVPTISAGAVVPSSKETRISPPLAATSTTWLLVRIRPSAVRMMPEPVPEPSAPDTSIWTTDGSTSAATDSTEPSSARSGAFETVLLFVPDCGAVDNSSWASR